MGSIRALLPTSRPADGSQRREVCPLVTEGTVDWRRPELDDGTHWVPTGLDRHFPQLGEPIPTSGVPPSNRRATITQLELRKRLSSFRPMMESRGFEPLTSAVQVRRSPH